MINYRNENFFQFIFKNKLPLFYGKSLNFVFIFIVLIVIILAFKTNKTIAIITLLFFWVGFIGLKLFFYLFSFYLYKLGNRVIVSFASNDIILLKDVKIFIKRFDMYSRKYLFSTFDSVIYDFDLADLAIVNNSLILMGKNNYFGGNQYLRPIEITNDKRLTKSPKVNIVSCEEKKGQIDLVLNDPNYKQTITLSFQSEIDKINKWLCSDIYNLLKT